MIVTSLGVVAAQPRFTPTAPFPQPQVTPRQEPREPLFPLQPFEAPKAPQLPPQQRDPAAPASGDLAESAESEAARGMRDDIDPRESLCRPEDRTEGRPGETEESDDLHDSSRAAVHLPVVGLLQLFHQTIQADLHVEIGEVKLAAQHLLDLRGAALLRHHVVHARA